MSVATTDQLQAAHSTVPSLPDNSAGPAVSETESATTRSSDGFEQLMLTRDNRLFGRAKELRVLQHAIDRTFQARNKDLQTPELGHDGQPTRMAESRPVLATDYLSTPFRTLSLLTGVSGSGKSALAMSFKQQCIDRHGFFVSGTFHLHQMDEPFAGVKAALEDLCQQMLTLGPNSSARNEGTPEDSAARSRRGSLWSLASLKRHITRHMAADELRVLSKIVPAIVEVISQRNDANAHDHTTDDQKSMEVSTIGNLATLPDMSLTNNSASDGSLDDKNSAAGFKEHSEGLKFVLRRFLEVVCMYCPLVMVVDDIQWADQASLDLIQSWMMNSNISSLMIIGCYRSHGEHGKTSRTFSNYPASALSASSGRHDLEGTNAALNAMMEVLEKSKRERCIRILHIDIGPLQADDVKELLRSLFAADVESTGELSDTENRSACGVAVEELSAHIHDKSRGNPYFVYQYLQSLIEHRLVTRRNHSLDWTWDMNDIRSRSPSVVTIIDMTKQKIEKQAYARYVLSVAGCLGATFSASMVSKVVRAMSIHSGHSTFFRKIFSNSKSLQGDYGLESSSAIFRFSESDIRRLFYQCHEAGFVVEVGQTGGIYDPTRMKPGDVHAGDRSSVEGSDERSSDDAISSNSITPLQEHHAEHKSKTKFKSAGTNQIRYTFAHDKVQEAALQLVPQDKLSELQYRVGEILLSVLSQKELNDKVFTVAGLLNGRHDLVPPDQQTISDRRNRVIDLNHKAATKAIAHAAFSPALEYLQKAIALLPEDRWTVQSRQTLDIYSAAAECAYINSQTDLLKQLSDEIIRADCKVLYKMRAYHILMDASSVQASHSLISDPSEMGLSVLSQLDCNFPKTSIGRTFKTILGITRLKSEAKKWTNTTFCDIPMSSDKKEAAVSKMLDKLTLALYFSSPELVPMVVMKSYRRTLANGVSPYSPPAFSLLALIMAFFLDNFNAADILAEAAMSMLDRLDSRVSESRTMLLANTCAFQWTRPLDSAKELYLRGFRSGMTTGDVESAMWCIKGYAEVSLICGDNLSLLEEHIISHSRLAGDVGKENIRLLLLVYLNALQELMGTSNRAGLQESVTVCEARDQLHDIAADAKTNPDEGSGLHTYARSGCRLLMTTIFGEFKTGADIIVNSYKYFAENLVGTKVVVLWLTCGGVCCYAASRQVQKRSSAARKYLKMAKQCRDKIKKWSALGSPSCKPFEAVLDAENYWHQCRWNDAIKKFDEAIRICRDSRFGHFEALSYERLGVLLSEVQRFSVDVDYHEASTKSMVEAVKLYGKWGATMKVKKLRRTLAGGDGAISTSTGSTAGTS